MAVASIALFVALGGASYAAISLPSNSIKSHHIAKNAVKRSEIAKNAVGRKELARNAVRSAHIADGSVQAADLADSAVPVYSAYLRPKADEKIVEVGWGSESIEPSAINYLGPGHYQFLFPRTSGERGCVAPMATVFGDTPATIRVIGAGCVRGTTSFQLKTSDGQDHEFFLLVGFTS